jgi:hypothetical protein
MRRNIARQSGLESYFIDADNESEHAKGPMSDLIRT